VEVVKYSLVNLISLMKKSLSSYKVGTTVIMNCVPAYSFLSYCTLLVNLMYHKIFF